MYRQQLTKILQRLENGPRRFIQVLYGPPQIGKTTLVLQLLGQTKMGHHYATADETGGDSLSWIAQQWEVARSRSTSEPSSDFILVLDEIQKIDRWSEQVRMKLILSSRAMAK